MSEEVSRTEQAEASGGETKKAKTYQRIKLRISLFSMAMELVLLLVFLLAGWSLWLRQLVEGWTSHTALQVLYYFVIVGGIGQILSLPIEYYSGFLLEHRYDLSTQSFKGWVWDWVKSLLLEGVLGLAILELVYWLLRSTGGHWWWIAALVMVALMVILAQLAPVIILPVFYKYRSLDRPELRQRLKALGEKCRTPIEGVYELELSSKSKAANAALAGLGHTRRVLLGDTLLENYTDDEIETVLAHELAHHYYWHIWKLISLQTGVIFAGFFLADRVMSLAVPVFGFRSPADLAAFPLLALTFVVLALVLLPVMNGFSRMFERQADRFAAEVTGRPEDLASALQKMARQNLADPEPNALVEWLFYSHPSIGRRVKALETRGQE